VRERGVVGNGTVNAACHVMKYLKKIIVISSLISMVAGCYVETHSPRYARRDCGYGRYWDGDRCHHRHW
jgi:hypothetical protein